MTSSEWSCSDTKCICEPGTLMCGGSTIDISGVVNAAFGKINVKCVNSTSCALNMEFISSFFPKGIALTSCKYGECVDQYATPISKSPPAVCLLYLSLHNFLTPPVNYWFNRRRCHFNSCISHYSMRVVCRMGIYRQKEKDGPSRSLRPAWNDCQF